MFAYCLNNPVNGVDVCGYITERIDSRFSFACDLDGGGGGGSGVRKTYLTEVYDFITNTSEVATFANLDQYGFAFYKGAPVFRSDLGDKGAFSYGIIVLDDFYIANDEGARMLKHERGHLTHMQEIGIIAYTITVAAPSLTGAGLDMLGLLTVDYYSLPWEHIADFYGGVNRADYESWACYQAILYWIFTQGVGNTFGGI